MLEQQIERKSADDEEQDHGLMAGPQQPRRRPLRQNVLVAVEAKEADVGNQDDDRSPAPQGIDPEIVLPIGAEASWCMLGDRADAAHSLSGLRH
jgi:hypothetical protein